MIRRTQYLTSTLSIASLLSILLLLSPVSLFSQDSNPASSDFNGDGVVDVSDYLLFVDVFGSKEGEAQYDAKYDLDGNGEIGIPDFLIFMDNFGKPVLAEPSNVVVEAGDSELTVGWDAVSDEVGKPEVTGYEVGYRERPDDPSADSGEWSGVETVSGRLNTSVTLTGLVNGQAYLVRVRTLVDGSMSAWTSPVSGIPVAASTSPPSPPSPPPQQQEVPPVTISAATPVTEGTDVIFTITTNPPVRGIGGYFVNVYETGAVIDKVELGTSTTPVTDDFTIETHIPVTIKTIDDDVDEPDSVVTLTVQWYDTTGNRVGRTFSASVTVNDNDPP